MPQYLNPPTKSKHLKGNLAMTKSKKFHKSHSHQYPQRRRNPFGLAATYQIYQAETGFPTNSQMVVLLAAGLAGASALAITKFGWARTKALVIGRVKPLVQPRVEAVSDTLFETIHEDQILARTRLGASAMAAAVLTDFAQRTQPVTVYIVDQAGHKPTLATRLKGLLSRAEDRFLVRDEEQVSPYPHSPYSPTP
jgi:hypothetical protein